MQQLVESFSPPFFLKNAHLQTLGSYFISKHKNPKSKTHLLSLPDGDQMALEISLPKGISEPKKVIFMMPGTAGSHLSPYLIRLTRRFLKLGLGVVRLNFRGVATALGLAKKISHGGASLDVYMALKSLKKLFPKAELTAIGFSLSGNTLLKLASEVPIQKEVQRIFAICSPVNLAKSSKRLEKPENKLYQRSIVQAIIKIIEDPQSQFEFTSLKPLKRIKTLREFDEAYTAPSWGFQGALDYYQKASCLPHLSKIEVETHLLFAKDDPLVDCSEILQLNLPKSFNLLCTDYGGHMGYLSASIKNLFWMDQQILSWILNH